MTRVVRLTAVRSVLFAAIGQAQAPLRGVWSLPPELEPLEWAPLFNGEDLSIDIQDGTRR